MRRIAVVASMMMSFGAAASAQPAARDRLVIPQSGGVARDLPGVVPDPVLEDALERLLAVHATAIDAAKIARGRTRNARILGYADRLLRDHRYAERRASGLADERNVAISPAIRRSEADGALLRRLQRLEDAAFERAFLDSMERMHARALTRLQSVRGRIRGDPELDALLERTAPILQQHRDLARALRDEARERETNGQGDVQGDVEVDAGGNPAANVRPGRNDGR